MDIEYKPAEIVYKPHCSNCGRLIDNDIEYRYVYREPTETMLSKSIYAQVYPGRCPNCGALFESINMPMPKKISEESIEMNDNLV